MEHVLLQYQSSNEEQVQAALMVGGGLDAMRLSETLVYERSHGLPQYSNEEAVCIRGLRGAALGCHGSERARRGP